MKFEKEITKQGAYGAKPNFKSKCKFILTDLKYSKDNVFVETDYLCDGVQQDYCIGNGLTNFDRILEQILKSMFQGEKSKIIIPVEDFHISCDIELVHFENGPNFHEIPTQEKLDLANFHKELGNQCFKSENHIDAFYQFRTGLHLILSCVLEVDSKSDNIDGVKLQDIDALTAILYNNIASCQLKSYNYGDVINLCNKVLSLEPNNMKAVGKRGRGYMGIKDFERAEKDIVKFLEYEPGNAFMKKQLMYAKEELLKSHAKFANMCERMLKC